MGGQPWVKYIMILRRTSAEAARMLVKKVILMGRFVEAKKGRRAKEMVFDYGKEWLGRIYPQKKIQVIYIEEGDRIIIITVRSSLQMIPNGLAMTC